MSVNEAQGHALDLVDAILQYVHCVQMKGVDFPYTPFAKEKDGIGGREEGFCHSFDGLQI